jgi:hypothetical protein
MADKILSELSLKELKEKETSLLSQISIIWKERQRLADINYELCDKDGANPTRELEDEMEQKMWDQECIHTELDHQLKLVRIWISKWSK